MGPQMQPANDDTTRASNPQSTDNSFIVAVQREQLFDEFESQWQSATRPSIETFLDWVPEADRADVLRELLGIELDQLLRRGEVPVFADYLARFSGQPAVVESVYRKAMNAINSRQPPKVARFQPIDRLGVGGQGEVWLMLDPDIDRKVAMKILQHSQRGSQSTLASFRREAEVSGKLEHPNIVPVYDLTAELNASGQADLDSPCYVMRVFGDPRLHVAIEAFHARLRSADEQPLLVALRAFDKEQSPEHRRELEGLLAKFSFDPQQACDQTLKSAVESILKEDSEAGTLTKAITKFHACEWSETVLRKLLSRFQRICEGVAYAHSRGVIHRDLKPDNIMLGEYGETLVADWGLAKVVGRDDEHKTTNVEGTLRVLSEVADPLQTRLGDLKGTPAYMSPEQAMGRIDELGPATDIYSLGAILYCILTGQPPFNGKTLEEILSRVRDGEFPRPTEVELRVPKALEAIVLKAMSIKARDRYAKSRDMAADVERWLNDEPVSAWLEPFTVRAKRWVKNHQTAVTSTAAAILMAMLTLSVMFAVVTGQKVELAKSLQRERDAKLLAQNSELRAIAGEDLARRNEQRAIQGEADAKSNAELAQHNEATANAQTALAKQHAEAATQQSQLALSTLASVIFDLNKSLTNVAGGAEVRNRLLSNVLPQLDKVSTQFASKSAVDHNTMFALIHLADTIIQLGNLGNAANGSASPLPISVGKGVGSEGQSAALTAERLYQRAHEIAKQLAAANPGDTRLQRDLSITFDKLGDVYYVRLRRNDDAIARYRDSTKILRMLAEADHNDRQTQFDYSISCYKFVDVLSQLGRVEDACKILEDKLAFHRMLAEADPNDAGKQYLLSFTWRRLGDALMKLGRTDDALQQYQFELKNNRGRIAAHPQDRLARLDLLSASKRIGDAYLKLGRTDDALVQHQDAIKTLRVWIEADPTDMEKQNYLQLALDSLGDIFLKLGRTGEALTQFQDRLKVIRVVAEADPSDDGIQNILRGAYHKLGGVLLTLGRTDDALMQFQAELGISQGRVNVDPNDFQKQRDLSATYEQLGQMLIRLGRPNDAISPYRERLRIRRMLADADPNDAQKQRDLANSYDSLGYAFLKLGHTEDAHAQYQEEMKISRVLADADPSNADNQRELALCHFRLGEVEVEAGHYEPASERFTQGIAVLDVMITKKQSVQLSQKQKAIFEHRRQFCISAKFATGDWEALQRTDDKSLPNLLKIRTTELAKRGQLAGVTQAGAKLQLLSATAEKGSGIGQKGGLLYNAACAYCLSVTLSMNAQTQPTESEQAERQKWLDLALTYLKEAVTAGYDNFEHIEQDTDLTPLRKLPEFQALLKNRPEKKLAPEAKPDP